MKHLGDITKIKNVDPVDCVTFGSPCQDLSIAGKRQGLNGERSGLFIDAVRIIKEMRENSNGKYPTFAVWENVPGAFSSNKGEDFRAVLEELARIKQTDISIPRPENGKWAKAGFICGNGWSIAWRTFDAQFWGVPQRRRRIAVVVDFAGQRAGEILFERTGVSGDSEPSITPWKEIARNPTNCTDRYDRVVEIERESLTSAIQINDKATRWMGGGKSRNHDGSGNGLGIGRKNDPMFTLTAGDNHAVLCRAHGQSNAETLIDCCPTLSCNHEQPIVFESHSQDARYNKLEDICCTCSANWGTVGNNMPLVTEPTVLESNQVHATITNNGICPTLSASMGMGGGYVPMIAEEIKLHWIVRRLTPTECERLQGFPDGWTNIGEWADSKGKRHKPADSPRYKALGNSIAPPQWWWITCKMAEYLSKYATLGSLFDGIGGFPLVWEARHGNGTALWASEIEEFPIAVTKLHFPDE